MAETVRHSCEIPSGLVLVIHDPLPSLSPNSVSGTLWVTNIRMRELLPPPSNPTHKSAEGGKRKRKMTSREQKKGVLHERLQLLRSVTNSSAVRSGVL